MFDCSNVQPFSRDNNNRNKFESVHFWQGSFIDPNTVPGRTWFPSLSHHSFVGKHSKRRGECPSGWWQDGWSWCGDAASARTLITVAIASNRPHFYDSRLIAHPVRFLEKQSFFFTFSKSYWWCVKENKEWFELAHTWLATNTCASDPTCSVNQILDSLTNHCA